MTPTNATTINMTISAMMLDFIKRQEDCRLIAYLCPGNKWTIGYGHTGYDVNKDSRITAAEADKLLLSDIRAVEEQLNGIMSADHVTVSQHQFDALVSLAFNIGSKNLKRSTLWKKITADPHDRTITNEFSRWVYSNGVKLKGLEKRRQAEALIYTTGNYDQ